MLQEILLCLAGHPSPLLRESEAVDTSARSEDYSSLISPPERALLSTVAHLSNLHRRIKKHATFVSASHQSTICRAVASCITSQQLQMFMTKIVDVERSILSKDAGYVGGYGIVPLSAVIGEFAPWARRLEWLWEVLRVMQPASESGTMSPQNRCTGSEIMRFLRKESHTGYTDLEEMALELVKTAEMVWVRQLSTWVLYGKLPSSDAEDFFIKSQPNSDDVGKLNLPEFSVHDDSVPDFVSPETASSILFIGQSLNQVRARDQNTATTSSSADLVMKLLPTHLQYLKTIDSPISSSNLTNIVVFIRISMSQNALSQLLPLSQVLEVMQVLHDFLLLGRGEFAQSFISNADKRMLNWHHGQEKLLPVRKACQTERSIKGGDLPTILSQTWSELVALETEEDLLDGNLEKARDLTCIMTKSPEAAQEADSTDFSSLVFSSPASLTLSLAPRSPLNLFLTQEDLASYSLANSYLLSLRRAEMHLAALWKHSSLRRCRPYQGKLLHTVAYRHKIAEKDERADRRNRQMRRYWAMASKSHFVLSELRGYLQGEIVQGHSAHFLSWLVSLQEEDHTSSETRPSTSTSAEQRSAKRRQGNNPEHFKLSQSSVASSSFRWSALNQGPRQSDPATLAKAHQCHIGTLRSALLLNMTGFTRTLLSLLRLLDHFVALFGRLQATQQNLDLEVDEGIIDPLADYRSDEQDVLKELERSRSMIEEHLEELVTELRSSVDHATGPWESVGQNLDRLDLGTPSYAPWRAPSIDGLLMKLENVSARPCTEDTEEDEEKYYSQ